LLDNYCLEDSVICIWCTFITFNLCFIS